MTAEHIACQPGNRLHDDVWCRTCAHAHIAEIPTVTYACSDCGFGAWLSRIAEAHATNYPAHIVYGIHHQTAPLADAAPPGTDALAESTMLCSQCGERLSCMVKIGTNDGWCSVCLDEAAETDALADAERAELEAYRAEDLRDREWAAHCAEADVRCLSCELRYGERDQYGCGGQGMGPHRYDDDELAQARTLGPPTIPRADPSAGGEG